ncbi:MAG: DUF2577 domain-containing protein [Firmicutes bacterium]|nr:DUF2577 domain-containing protein [[Eubacterium] siraeum]MCM1488575.1 DUF2577 domain-containing protein [Bacillota bacterium]
MAEAAELLKIIKAAAASAVSAEKPAELCFGTVTSTAPLKITVEQKLTLTEKQLILTKAVTDHTLDIEVSHYTVNDGFMNGKHTHTVCAVTDSGNLDTVHKHAYKGRKRVRIYNGLLAGETVLLLRVQGGQRFVVLDRLCEHTAVGEWV